MSFFKKILGGQKEPKPLQQDVAEPVAPAVVDEDQSNSGESALTVSSSQIFLQTELTSKEEALSFIAQKLSALGFVSGDYYGPLAAREDAVSTYLINGVAIPHGVNEAKQQVVKTGVCVVQIPAGITWNDKGDVATLLVGIAAKGTDHLSLLQRLTEVVMNQELAATLATTTAKEEILQALNGSVTPQAEVVEDYQIIANAKVVDRQGMHARPASLLAEKAAEFSGTDIRIRNGEKTANATSMAALLTMGASFDDELVVSAQGAQAKQAVQILAEMINNGLDSDDDQDNAAYQPLTVLSELPDVKCRLTLTGSAASPGITMAPAFRLQAGQMKFAETADDAQEEAKRFGQALNEAEHQLDELEADLQSKAPKEAAILKAQKQLLKDELVVADSKAFIAAGKTAAWSFHQAIEKQIDKLSAVQNERLQARVADLADVRDRVLALMVPAASAVDYPDSDFILMAKDLTPSQTAGLNGLKVRGICTELGGPNSHMAILARALGIPAMVGLGDGSLEEIDNGELVIVDPQASSVYIDPDQETQANGKRWIEQWEQICRAEDAQKHKPAETLDGHHIDVVCNIAKPEDAAQVLEHGGEGVGLLRTEFLFEASPAEPTIDEQFESLKAIVEVLGSRQLIVRTADIGGDKPVSWMHIPHEDNPFLGMRGIRLSFKYEDIFKRQLEAIYKTAKWQLETTGATGIHIMFPMIGRLREWHKAREIAEQVRLQLAAPQVPLGIMIEVPSAVMIADHLAQEVDFFSIGSNDLTQYTLAIDRLHSELCCEDDSYHPALLKMIEMTVRAAQEHGKWVGVCGNAAANPNIATLLVGLGVTELSVSPANVAAAKNIIRAVKYSKLKEKANKALQLGTSKEIMDLYKINDDLL